MLKHRIYYLLLLVCTGLFFICFNGYMSLYVFVLSLFLPLVSLLVSLPGMLGARLELSLGAYSAKKGGSVPLRIKVYNISPLVSGRVKVRLTVKNTLTGEERREDFFFTAGKTPQALEHQLTSPYCGRVVCALSRSWVCDYLGIFSFPMPIRTRGDCAAFFYPTLYPLDLTVHEGQIPDSEGERFSQTKPGDDPSELFGLREYREGDRLSRINWKLSEKLGQTLVKEMSLPISDHIFFLLELNGNGKESDALLDAFATLSGFLAEGGHAHRTGYTDGKTGRFTVQEIVEESDALPALQAVLCAGGSLSLPPLVPEDLPTGISHALYLSGKPGPEAACALRSRWPSAKVSILHVTEALGASQLSSPAADAAGARLLLVKPGFLTESLNGLEL